MELDKRNCKIGRSINARTENHNSELVPAFDIPLENVLLTAEELNELLGDKHASVALFNTKGRAIEPTFRQFHPMELKFKFEDSTVTFLLGLKPIQVTVSGVKLARITVDPLPGGLTAVSMQVQCKPKLDKEIGQLMEFMGREVSAIITIGPKIVKAEKQPELPMGEVKKAGDKGDEKVVSINKPRKPRSRKPAQSTPEHPLQ